MGKIPALYENIPTPKSRLAKVIEFLDCHQTYVLVLWEIVFDVHFNVQALLFDIIFFNIDNYLKIQDEI